MNTHGKNTHGKYYYGKPKDGQFEHVIDAFVAHEAIHSVKTSSLPLVQFWHDSFVEDNVTQIEGVDELKDVQKLQKIRDILLDANSRRYFEYATPVHKHNDCGEQEKPLGKASMTDLMLLVKQSSQNYKVAIEAKFTEYQDDLQYRPTVKIWKNKKSDKKEDGKNREKVLDGWIEYITESGGKLSSDNLDEIPYQLIHRIASACAKDEDGETRIPIVLYHLFYDEDDMKKVNDFHENLRGWVEKLDLKGVGFYVLKTKIKIRDSVFIAKEEGKRLNDLFMSMKNRRRSEYCEVKESKLICIRPIPSKSGD